MLWADRVEYNTDEKKGKFYNVRGGNASQGGREAGHLLVSDNPFHFEGQWAEAPGHEVHPAQRLPSPTANYRCPGGGLRGKTFDITPGEQAISRNATFFLRKSRFSTRRVFYHSLEKVPRKSGFLLPMVGTARGAACDVPRRILLGDQSQL